MWPGPLWEMNWGFLVAPRAQEGNRNHLFSGYKNSQKRRKRILDKILERVKMRGDPRVFEVAEVRAQ